MRKHIIWLSLFLFISASISAQTKLVLDSKILGGHCTDYFDLNERGFILQYTKGQNADVGRDKKTEKVSATFYYFSKDLTKRATLKADITYNVKAFANEALLIITDEFNNLYTVNVFDYTGKKVASFYFNITNFGLNSSQISRMFFTDKNQLVFEVIDIRNQTHLFYIDVLDKNTEFKQADIPLPSSNPLKTMQNTTNWMFLQETKGFYVMYRVGTNAEFGATSASCHLAFYASDFTLYRELLIDNILQPGQSMMSKNFALTLNYNTQQVIVSAIINNKAKPQVLTAAYGLSQNSVLMKQLWRNETDLIISSRHRIIDLDGVSIPPAPTLLFNGNSTYALVGGGRGTISEEKLNQFICINQTGQITYNMLQKGTLESLNLDAYCVDADNMYDRIHKLKMQPTLKSFCEQVSIEALDIFVGDNGEELAILKDNARKLVNVFYFK
ncbi:MAG: hypothetical protein ACK4K9_03690 [Bacteroidia bacterium]